MVDWVEGYQGRHVVVTGCASGIGAATARALIELGAEVCGLDRRTPDFAIPRFVPIDLGDPRSIDTAMTAIGDRADALFNCAGLSPTLPGLDVLRVNFLGTRQLTTKIAERMGEGGAIVSTSSNGGCAGGPIFQKCSRSWTRRRSRPDSPGSNRASPASPMRTASARRR